ncbi:conserved membrane hypothetical protein [Sphingomonas sp. EC-HK361]|uniref:hypothetical protein n=1 Tax=Sphingomonas sp. EC-HK361 TaxID=2038397 RepID=UPI0012564707|nr:hypothetical protein [Sphingomonas sp. EC-HK361]VVT15161.1 conserved membrane hypothetical protein [Sphingomonas sp. EC-HK361]
MWMGAATVVIGMTVVRHGWAGKRARAVAGWLIVAVGLLGMTWLTGAWGLTIGCLVATTLALSFVLYAGWTAPAKLRRPLRSPPSIELPRRWRGFGRRLAVFALVVPVAFAAAQWFAFGAQAFARGTGAGATNATALSLFVQPAIWAVVMSVQMTRADPWRMIAAPAAAALLGTLLWAAS